MFHDFAVVAGTAGGLVGLVGFAFTLWCYRDVRRNTRITRENLIRAAELREETRLMREERERGR
jgi:hypothetical protein